MCLVGNLARKERLDIPHAESLLYAGFFDFCSTAEPTKSSEFLRHKMYLQKNRSLNNDDPTTSMAAILYRNDKI